MSVLVAAPLITEFSASNGGELYDEDGDSSDWIEVHNPDAVAVDLGGYALTNDAGNLEGWRLPALTLPAGGYLVVFASGKDRGLGELHTNFRLSKGGGFLALVEVAGLKVVSSYAAYPEQPEGFSYGLAQTGTFEDLAWIPEDAACRILVPTVDIGTGWRGLGFDDTGWDAGNTGVGYEEGNGYQNLIGANGDVGAEMYQERTTAYVRIPFLVNDLTGINKMTLRMKYDDGFVAFLNGTRVADGNPPNGALAFDSGAGGDHNDGLATEFEDTDLTPFLGDLVPGDNVLAVHGLNNGTGSSDFLILPELNAERVTNPGVGGEGYFGRVSPGAANGSAAAQGLPAGDVVFSEPGRGYTGMVSLQLSTEAAGAEIRYTTDGDVPTAGSALYSGPMAINQSTLVRARVFEAGKAPGAVGEEGYIELDPSAASFSSDIPVVVMERFSGGPSADNGKSFAFFAFFEPDPVSGRTTLNKPYALGTRGGWKTRGSSSSGFPKKAYSIEAWDEVNENKNIGPLGLPRESDWILSARYTFDRALMRNPLIYRLSNEVGRYAVRTRFVELFKNDNGGNLTYGTADSQDYDGVYTFMEKIARDGDRVDVERLPASVTSEPGIAGGYMLKVDRLDPGDSGLRGGGQTMGWVYPKERNVTAEQEAWMGNYLDAMNAALNAVDFADPVTGYAKYIDVDSWIDHHLLNVLTLNADALRLSTYFFKTRTGKVEFGPIWDFDRSMESTDGRDDSPLGWNGGTNYFTFQWWNRLFRDENFWQRYIDRYFEFREGPLSTANVGGVIDAFADELAESQARNFQRWSGAPPRRANQTVGGVTGLNGTHRGEANYLKDWLSVRMNWMDGQFVARATANRPAGVYPAGTTVTLTANLAGGKRIFYTLDGGDPRGAGVGTEYSGPIRLDESARLVVRVMDPRGWAPPGGARFPTAWSAPVRLDYLIDEVAADETSLVVSEIMHEPYPLGDAVTGRGEFEFFEVMNVSDGRISLNDVRVTDGVVFDFSEARIRSLAPGERVVVVKNRAAFAGVYGTVALARVAGEFSGALANGGELLELRDVGGAVIREVNFLGDATWVADEEGKALVLTGSGDPDEGSNWSVGGSLLGTPGFGEAGEPGVVVNEVLTNSVVPEVDVIELWNTSGVAVDLGGWFLTDDLGEPEKFRIPEGTMIGAGAYVVFSEVDFNPTPGAGGGFALSSSGEEVFLVAAAPADGARLGTVDGFDFGDASAGVPFGRHVMSTGETVVAPLDGLTAGGANAVPAVGPLVVDELMYHPADGGVEFIELRNVSGAAVPLAGVEVSGVGWVFGALAPELEAGGVVLLVEIDPEVFRGAFGVPVDVAIYGPMPGKLDNGGETVRVRVPEADPEGGGVLMVESDRVKYNDAAPWPADADGSGVSLQRVMSPGYGSDPVSWVVSGGAGGTPGTRPVTGGDWREAYFTAAELADPSISGFLADADFDGLANLLEYVLGSDLRSGGSRGVVEVRVLVGGDVEIEYTVRDGVAGFSLVVERSGALGVWADVSDEFVEVTRTANGDGTTTLVRQAAGGVGAEGFVRLRVRGD